MTLNLSLLLKVFRWTLSHLRNDRCPSVDATDLTMKQANWERASSAVPLGIPPSNGSCSLLLLPSRVVAPRERRAGITRTARPMADNQGGGQPPRPSHLPNGKSKLGQLNTVRWLQETTGDSTDHWPPRPLGLALSRATVLGRNERNPTGTFPRSNSSTWSCFVDHQPGCSGRVPWEPPGGVPFIWCPSFDFPF